MTPRTERQAPPGLDNHVTFEANRGKPLTSRNQWEIRKYSPERHVFFCKSERHVFFCKSSSYLMNIHYQVSRV